MSVDVAPEQARKLKSTQNAGSANVPKLKCDFSEQYLRFRPSLWAGKRQLRDIRTVARTALIDHVGVVHKLICVGSVSALAVVTISTRVHSISGLVTR